MCRKQTQQCTLLIQLMLLFQTSSVPHTRPETPRSVTHNHDEDCSDEESDPVKNEEEE